MSKFYAIKTLIMQNIYPTAAVKKTSAAFFFNLQAIFLMVALLITGYAANAGTVKPGCKKAASAKPAKPAVLSLPTVSYSSPQTFTVNAPITSLTPTGSGVAAIAYSSTMTAKGAGFNNPVATVVDAAGDIYVADKGSNTVKKIPAGSNIPVTVGSGFSSPNGLALDAAGNLYVADLGNNAIKKVPVGGGAVVTLGSGFSHPTGVAVDAAGNVFISDKGNNAIDKIPAGSNTPILLYSVADADAIAIDGQDNIYILGIASDEIIEYTAGSSSSTTIPTT